MKLLWKHNDDEQILRIILSTANCYGITIDYFDNHVSLKYHEKDKVIKVKIPDSLAIKVSNGKTKLITLDEYNSNKSNIDAIKYHCNLYVKDCHKLYNLYCLTVFNTIFLYCLSYSDIINYKIFLILALINNLKCISIKKTLTRYFNEHTINFIKGI
jgi:hypothetical protein